MRASLFTAFLTALPSAFAWQITVYREQDCADNDGNFDYYTFESMCLMDYCWGIKEDSFPNGVACSYFSEGGTSGPHPCDGQIDNAKSIKVVRGKVMFWSEYDTHPSQPDDRRCGSRLTDFPDTDKHEEGGSVFHQEDYRCRNAYYSIGSNNRKVWKDIKGFRAWD